MPAEVTNPTGIAFDPEGTLFVTNRSDGWVVKIERGEDATTYAADSGVATGIAFDQGGTMYVGDRSGTIYRIPEPGFAETFAVLEPSVAVYHMAFGPDGKLTLLHRHWRATTRFTRSTRTELWTLIFEGLGGREDWPLTLRAICMLLRHIAAGTASSVSGPEARLPRCSSRGEISSAYALPGPATWSLRPAKPRIRCRSGFTVLFWSKRRRPETRIKGNFS